METAELGRIPFRGTRSSPPRSSANAEPGCFPEERALTYFLASPKDDTYPGSSDVGEGTTAGGGVTWQAGEGEDIPLRENTLGGISLGVCVWGGTLFCS